MTPKCTGSMPNALATGRKIGVQMMIIGARSMNVPMTSSTTIITSSALYLLSATRGEHVDRGRRNLQVGQQPAERRRRADHEQDQPGRAHGARAGFEEHLASVSLR